MKDNNISIETINNLPYSQAVRMHLSMVSFLKDCFADVIESGLTDEALYSIYEDNVLAIVDKPRNNDLLLSTNAFLWSFCSSALDNLKINRNTQICNEFIQKILSSIEG